MRLRVPAARTEQPDGTRLQRRRPFRRGPREHYDVHNVYYEPHVKRNAEPGTPRTMRVDYEVAPTQYKSEWVCPEHTGYARSKFERWWRERACPDCPVSNTVDEAVA